MEQALRTLVWRRARSRCEYCLLPSGFEEATFEIDHVIAEKHRGPTTAENLALACFACNNHKGPNIAGTDPSTGQTVPLFHPRLQSWNENFRYLGATLEGITAIGRATVQTLEINLPHRVALRQTLLDEGEWDAAVPDESI